MSFDCIAKDPDYIDLEHPADLVDLLIPSHGSVLFGVMYAPQGKGPHPTVLLLHGFPGSERNFDLAQILRRAGFNVIIFHYRGSWGSEGKFSFQNVLEDSETVIKYLLDPVNAKKYSIDTSKFVLMGHSMGGFSTLITGAKLPEVTKMVAIAPYNFGAVAKKRVTDPDYAKDTYEMFLECALFLKGTDHEILLDEIRGNASQFDFCEHVSGFRGKDLLVIGGARDSVSHPEVHHRPLVQALKDGGISTAEEAVLDASHSFHCKRVKLAETILEWLEREKLL